MTTHNDRSSDASDLGPLLTAHALNDLSEREQDQVEQVLAADPEAGQTVAEVKRLATALRETCAEPAEPPVVALREAVVARLDELDQAEGKVSILRPEKGQWRKYVIWGSGALALSMAVGFGGFSALVMSTHKNWSVARSEIDRNFDSAKKLQGMGPRATNKKTAPDDAKSGYTNQTGGAAIDSTGTSIPELQAKRAAGAKSLRGTRETSFDPSPHGKDPTDFGDRTAPRTDLTKRPDQGSDGSHELKGEFLPFPPIKTSGGSSATSPSGSNGTGGQQYSDDPGKSGQKPPVNVSGDGRLLTQSEIAERREKMKKSSFDHAPWQPVHSTKRKEGQLGLPNGNMITGIDGYRPDDARTYPHSGDTVVTGEQYEAPPENAFLPVDKATALSTFSIDVDTASYANVRRFLSQGQLPPPHAVRIEELLNYFRYTYPQPQGEDPFSVNMELADCPWQPGHELLRIGIKGKEVAAKERKAGNLVFLVDVSGSMQPENKLPLLKQAFKMLVNELTENDTVTIVTYAGDAGLKLDATNGTRQNEIRSAIDSLSAGGSTHGSAGIELAYQQAAKSFIKGGTNRVILATDGDLNVGITSDDALVDLIKTKAAGGVFLTVLGVGEGNLKDAKMEKLADNGNGVYAYLDSLREARKVLVEQLSGSLETIAKDVKIQIEFNPAEVQAYRLIGYENRMLATRDFHDDKKDAGEIGAGHTVTALYELVPAKAKAAAKAEARGEGEPLKYQKTPDVKPAPEALTPAAGSGEALTLKLRYKEPAGETSKLREFPLKSEAVRFNRASADFQFAAAVASFGMLLKNSQHRGDATFSAVEEIAAGSIGPDASGYRAEFLDLVRKAKTLK